MGEREKTDVEPNALGKSSLFPLCLDLGMLPSTGLLLQGIKFPSQLHQG